MAIVGNVVVARRLILKCFQSWKSQQILFSTKVVLLPDKYKQFHFIAEQRNKVIICSLGQSSRRHTNSKFSKFVFALPNVECNNKSRVISKLFRTNHDNIIINSTMETTSNNIQSLPDELLLAIFINIPPEELVLTIPLVCQRWSHLHTDTRLYRHLVFKDNKPDTTVAVKLIKMAPQLKYLKMAFRSDTHDVLRHVAICNPLLETLKLRNCRGMPNKHKVHSVCLRNVIEYCTKLQHLSLRKTICQSREFFNEIGHHLPLLRAVDFGHSAACHEVELLNNADKFRQLLDLRIFSKVSDVVVTRFCEKHSSFLTTVKLNIKECTDASLKALANCLQLRTLYLDKAKATVTDVGIMEISKLSNLEKLYISNAEVTSECWINLFQTPHMKRITNLSLEYCDNVNYDVLITIAQNLSDIQILSLVLCGNIGYERHCNIHQMLPQHCQYRPRI
jgi:F-box-like